MNKIIALSLITVLMLFIIGCGEEKPVIPTPVEKNTIEQNNEAITNVDNTLVDIEDTETDAELDDINNILNKI